MSNLILLGGHPSASQRRIASLAETAEALRQQCEHLKAHLAVAVVQAGGVITIPVIDLTYAYDISAVPSEDEKSLIWTAARQKLPPPAPADESAST